LHDPIITRLTLELDAMTYAEFHPPKRDVALAIPPLQDFAVPLSLRKSYAATQLGSLSARKEFIREAPTNYCSEWFRFPYQ
jgi:hypothetical protein